MPDRFRASDLTDEHLGRSIRAEGVEGVLRDVSHLDDLLVRVLVDRDPYLVNLPAGRPVELDSPLDLPPG